MNDLRNNISYINYVREGLLADVHVLGNRVSMGSSGYEYSFRFIGRNEFEGLEFEKTFRESADMILADRWKGIRETIEGGLIPFWSQTAMTEDLDIRIVSNGKRARKSEVIHDPWNHWVFGLEGGASADFETARQESTLWGRVSIERVTELWRIRNYVYSRGDFQVFMKDEEEIRSVRNRKYIYSTVVRSIDDHWSAGAFVSASSSTFGNTDLSTRIAPAFEYSIYPYSEVQERELTISYRISHFYRDYTEETIFNEFQEHLFGQSLVMAARFTQPWGNLYAQLEGSHFFHDIMQNRIEFEGRLSIRIIKGLSLSFGNEFELIRDQRSLPKRDISLEELLLAQRQAATSFRLGGQMGISYTFGSIYNNVVNTRL